MKIVLLGDSITDMQRQYNAQDPFEYGAGYPFFIKGELACRSPKNYEVFNKGISGNRIVDIYARIKEDCWNLQPDVVSLLVGINDVAHEITRKAGVEVERYEIFLRMLVADTQKMVQGVKLIILEPFVLKGSLTKDCFEEYLCVKQYAQVARRVAKEYGCIFVPLQDRFDCLAQRYGAEEWLYDGVHPKTAGSKIIAEEWLRAFEKI